MYTIRTLNNIAKTGLAKLPEQNFVIDEKAENPEGIILRSFDMHKMELNESLLAVARAGAGTNNIPIEKCTQKGVPVFNTPGANANAVKELVLAGLFASSRRIIAGAAWVQGLKDNCESVEKAVEAGKKEFTGPEIAGKTLGVIGLGAIGVQVANAALDLGMEVIGYDPFLSLESAWHLSPNVVHEESMEELVAKADYITLHIHLNYKTRNTFDEKLFAATKPGARLLNFARGGLVDNAALKKAIADGHHRNASAVKVALKRREAKPDYTGEEEFNYYLSVLFAAEDLYIMDYNRVVKDLNGYNTEEFMQEIGKKFDIAPYTGEGPYHPEALHTFGLYLDGKWFKMTAKEEIITDDPVLGLDVSILQKELLEPVLAIGDPRTDKRIDFVGGIRGLGELERRVDSGEMRLAFSMFPTSMEELMDVADEDMTMPPKSTWFEPKLRSGLFIHDLGE